MMNPMMMMTATTTANKTVLLLLFVFLMHTTSAQDESLTLYGQGTLKGCFKTSRDVYSTFSRKPGNTYAYVFENDFDRSKFPTRLAAGIPAAGTFFLGRITHPGLYQITYTNKTLQTSPRVSQFFWGFSAYEPFEIPSPVPFIAKDDDGSVKIRNSLQIVFDTLRYALDGIDTAALGKYLRTRIGELQKNAESMGRFIAVVTYDDPVIGIITADSVSQSRIKTYDLLKQLIGYLADQYNQAKNAKLITNKQPLEKILNDWRDNLKPKGNMLEHTTFAKKTTEDMMSYYNQDADTSKSFLSISFTREYFTQMIISYNILKSKP